MPVIVLQWLLLCDAVCIPDQLENIPVHILLTIWTDHCVGDECFTSEIHKGTWKMLLKKSPWDIYIFDHFCFNSSWNERSQLCQPSKFSRSLGNWQSIFQKYDLSAPIFSGQFWNKSGPWPGAGHRTGQFVRWVSGLEAMYHQPEGKQPTWEFLV